MIKKVTIKSLKRALEEYPDHFEVLILNGDDIENGRLGRIPQMIQPSYGKDLVWIETFVRPQRKEDCE